MIQFEPAHHPLITVNYETGCWIGNGFDTGKGHQAVAAGGSKVLGHVLYYAALIGPVARGSVLHHMCGVKSCWNPWHLKPVNAREHSAEHTAQRAACPHGHPYPENAFHDSGGALRCRICTTNNKKVAKERAKARRVWVCTCGVQGGRDQFPLVGRTTPRCESCGRQGGHHIKPK